MNLQQNNWATFEEPESAEVEADKAQQASVAFCLYSADKDSIRDEERRGLEKMEAISDATDPVFASGDPCEEILIIFKRNAPPFGDPSTDVDGTKENAARKLRLAYLLRRCADRLDRSL